MIMMNSILFKKITIKDRTKNFFAQLGPLADPTIHLRINIEKILMGRKWLAIYF